MMQEVGNDSNGESTFDFVADANKNTPPPASLAPTLHSSLPKIPPSNPTPVYAAPPGTTSITGQKPSYAFPQANSDISKSFSSSGNPPNSLSTANLPPSFKSPLSISPKPIHQTSIFPASGSNSNAPTDLAEIFGSDVISRLPPLQPFPQSLQPVSLAPRGSIDSTSFAPPPFFPPTNTGSDKPPPWNDPPPLLQRSAGSAGVNPYSSQAAAGHLPSFFGFQPPMDSVRPPSLTGFAPAHVNHPVSIMPITALPPVDIHNASQLAGPLVRPSVSTCSVGSDGSYSVIDTRIPAVYGQTVPNAPIDYSASPSYSQPYSVTPMYQQPQSYGGGGEGGNSGNKSMMAWWTSTTLDTLKTVTEKAKSTAYGLINTLDPQMKQFSNAAGSEGNSAVTGADVTLFYIGNELNITDAIKSGVEFSYRNVHIYSRSGAAPGHKQQISFANALSVATSTLQLAQSNPQLQSMALLAVEPFVVELMPEMWYACTCVVLSDPLKGALLHCFSQSIPLPAGVISQSGERQLSMPLDELLTRQLSLTNRDTWSEQIGGVSSMMNATIALAVRQLFASYRKFS